MTSPENPGDPRNTDEQNLTPDQVESIVDGASQAQGVDEAGDTPVSTPDPSVAIDGDEPEANAEAAQGSEEASVEEALRDAAADAKADEALAAEADEGSESVSTDEDTSVEAQLAERTEDLQRLSAEYANYRRRTQNERQSVIDGAKASVLTQLLPILDDLDLARRHGDLDEGPLKGVADKISGVFTSQKVEAFGAEGEEFDPEIHEAVQDLSNGDEKVVGTVLRKGYRLGERVIRTAMVIIADPEAPKHAAPESE